MKKQNNLAKYIHYSLICSLIIMGILVFAVPSNNSVNSTNTTVFTQEAVAASNSKEKVCKELKNLDPDACASDSSTILQGIIKPIIQTLIYVIGALSVLVIIAGGLLYVISAGDANKIKQARDAILYAIVGLVVAILAQGIVSFVIGAVG